MPSLHALFTRLVSCLVLVCLSTFFAFSQIKDIKIKPKLNALRISETISIDGSLDEPVWSNADPATGFIISDPNPGVPSKFNTEIKILYTNVALYIGATFYDPNPDSIEVSLTERDDIGNADWFGLIVSPYNDGINGVGFVVSAAGVQFDEKWTGNNTDQSWDMVWNSEVRITEQGWVAELEIPFSALRFATVKEGQEAEWGINFARTIRRTREEAWWNFIDPEQNGVVNQLGLLGGLEGIKSPLRLSLTPYVSSYFETYSQSGEATQTGYNFNGGLDLKYGITDAFTLDMTLIPDFGQVQFDNQVLNLSPFEVRFDERRPFFMEGTELFNKAGLFYSRRIGSTPIGINDVEDKLLPGEEIIFNPRATSLLNGMKVSGRTAGGLGIGVFNSITGREFATVKNIEGLERTIETSPLTNYNIFVLDQNLKNNNSYVTLTNTNVSREGSWYEANVTGLDFKFRDKKGKWEIGTSAKVSQKYTDGFTDPELGHTWGVGLSKLQGNWTFETGYYEESDTYDPNDLAFLFNNNERAFYGYTNYSIYEPFWKLNKMFNFGGFSYQHLYTKFEDQARPNTFANFVTEFGSTLIWKSFLANGLNFVLEPITTYDYFDPRIPGRFFEYPKNFRINKWISTDYRKTFALDARVNYRWFEDDRFVLSVNIEPRWRISDKMLLILSATREMAPDDVGFATIQNEEDVIYGRRDLLTNESVIQANYIFSPKMWVNFRLRHYWSKAEYSSFFLLDPETGRLEETTYTGYEADGTPLHDANFNAFTIDAGFNWRFAPGSDLTIVWKNAIFNFDNEAEQNYFDNLNRTFDAPQTNNISLKLVYYLDYVLVQKWFNNGNKVSS